MSVATLLAYPRFAGFSATIQVNGGAGSGLRQLGFCSDLVSCVAAARRDGYDASDGAEWVKLQPGMYDPWTLSLKAAAIEEIVNVAIAVSEVAAGTIWIDQANKALEKAAHEASEITSDEVWEILVDDGYGDAPSPSAMGAIFRSAAKAGTIRKTDRTRRSRRQSQHRPITIWRSLVYQPVSLLGAS